MALATAKDGNKFGNPDSNCSVSSLLPGLQLTIGSSKIFNPTKSLPICKATPGTGGYFKTPIFTPPDIKPDSKLA